MQYCGLFLTTRMRAEPPGGESEEGEKTSIAPFAAIKYVRDPSTFTAGLFLQFIYYARK